MYKIKSLPEIYFNKTNYFELTDMLCSYGKDYQSSFNSIYPQLAEEHDISLYSFLLEGVALNSDLNQSDGKHPNSRGIALISKKIAENIKKIIN